MMVESTSSSSASASPEFNLPDTADVYTYADALHKRDGSVAHFILGLLLEEFDKSGATASISMSEVWRDYAPCASVLLRGVLYLQKLGVIEVEPNDAPTQCFCDSCQLGRLTIQFHAPMEGLYSDLYEQRRAEAEAEALQQRIREMRPKQRVSGIGSVYLVRAGERFKIGIATDVRRRLDQLNSGQSPFPVQLIHSAENARYREMESRLHARFAPARVHGEWFSLSPEQIAAVIESMNEWGASLFGEGS